MPRSRRSPKKPLQPVYQVVGRWLDRVRARAGGSIGRFWHDLTMSRGRRYYRALALFCVICLFVGVGASYVWRSTVVQSAFERYRAVFVGRGDDPGPVPPGPIADPSPGNGPGGADPAVGDEPDPADPVEPEPEPAGPAAGHAGGAGTGGGSGTGSGDPAPIPDPPPRPRPDLDSLMRPVTGPVVLGQGWQFSTTFGDWRFHPGVDIQAAAGSEVRAALAGAVVAVDDSYELGLYCTIDCGGGIEAVYGGLKTCVVQVGQEVDQGQIIGRVGDNAPSEPNVGAHLHFELRDGDEALDPETYWP